MDPLTQGLLGASVGQAFYGRSLGRSALVFGALVGMAPDLDVVMNGTSPTAEWLWHRGPTHALWFGPVVGPVIGWLLWRWRGGRLRDWAGLATLALFTHPLLDVFTSYGTQLLAPFSRVRVAWDAVAIVDPLYSLLLAAGVVLGWSALRSSAPAAGWSGLRSSPPAGRARVAAWAALVASTVYLALGLAVNARAEALARAQLAAEGVVNARVAAYPTLLQLPYRRIVARSGELVRVGWLSLLAPRPIAWESFRPAKGPLVEAARRVEEVRILEWFAMGAATPRLSAAADGSATVEFDDLRYGFPGKPRDGLWGVRVRVDRSGRPLGPGQRFRRALPGSARELLGRMWTETLGVS